MIAERIFNGETAEEIGISETEYQSRRETLSQFLDQWDREGEFASSFTEWLIAKNTRELSRQGGENPPAQQREGGPDEVMVAPPSAAKMVSGLSSSIAAIMKSGISVVSKEEHTRRYTLCGDCSQLQKGRCLRCGCFMKLKSSFSAMSCPDGKW